MFKTLLVVPILLLLSSAASAAFTFTISASPVLLTSPNVVDTPGSSGTFHIFAQTDQVSPEFFTVSSAVLNYSNDDGTITSAPVFPAGTLVATPGGIGNDTGDINWSILGGAVNGDNDTFTLTVTGLTSGIVFGGPTSPFSFTTGSASVTAVPEPTSLALVGLGGLGYAAYRRRRAAKA